MNGHGRNRPMEVEGADPVVARALASLDPGHGEPGYWSRFHRGVMAAASRELARRRLVRDVTVGDVVFGWGRALVPSAMLAAAVAAFLLLQSESPPRVIPLGVEEMLADGLEGATIPAVLTSESPLDAGGMRFASESY